MKYILLLLVIIAILGCEKKYYTPEPTTTKTSEDHVKDQLNEIDEILKENRKILNRSSKSSSNRSSNIKNSNFKPSSRDIGKSSKTLEAAISNLNGKNYEAALDNFLKILKDEPENEKIYENIIYVYAQLDDLTNIKKYSSKLLELNKNNLYGLIAMGNILFKNKRYREALTYYKKLSAKKGGYEIYFNLGVIYEKMKKYRESLDSYEKAVKIKPSAETYYAMAVISSNIGKRHQTLSLLQKALKLDRNNLKIKLFLADSYIQSKKYKEAVQTYKLIPDNKKSLTDIKNEAAAYQMLKNYTKASHFYQKAYQKDKNDHNLIYNIALCEYYNKNKEEMKKYISIFNSISDSSTQKRKLKVLFSKLK